MTDLIMVSTEGPGAPEPLHETPAPAKLIEGSHATTTWNHWEGESGRLWCGIWRAEPGTVAIDYTEWEFCHVISGAAVLTNEAGRSWAVRAGDAFIIPPGLPRHLAHGRAAGQALRHPAAQGVRGATRAPRSFAPRHTTRFGRSLPSK